LATDEFKQGAKQCVHNFIDVYDNDNVAPYIHAMIDATYESVNDVSRQHSSFYTAGTMSI